ncbi:MAG: M20/M25/M40 family metallo-hydrolase [Clostridia bacterium]|nr:M20/M25/M40 family metallo-hydrolase [Clostridia bacterium]
MELRELIPAMAGLMSITGYETYDAERLTALLQGFDEDITDPVGNRILVRRCGRENAPKILIDTHFDEIGLHVSDIRDGGFLKVEGVGGLDGRTLPSADVRIYGKQVLEGVIASTPPHLKNKDDEEKVKPVSELLIDTGYPTEELRELVRIGTPVGFTPRYTWLQNDRLVGKGMDNKACCAIAAHALRDIPAAELAGDVYLVFAVHEETDRVGGTAVGGFSVEPDYAMVIDVNIGHAPGSKEIGTVEMGKGPSICRSAITDRRLTKMTEALCERGGIPWQRCVDAVSTGTDTVSLHLVGKGIPVVDVGLPLRAMHTYVEMLDMTDAEYLAALVRAFVTDKEIGEVFA